jgi:hypothetical protein
MIKHKNLMKTKMMIAAGMVFLFGSICYTANAQQAGMPEIKVLPGADSRTLKLLVVGAGENVEVRFFGQEGEIATDLIKEKEGVGSFVKKYDVRKLTLSEYWMEINTAGLSTTYRIVAPAKNKKLVPMLAKTSYTYPVIAANAL